MMISTTTWRSWLGSPELCSQDEFSSCNADFFSSVQQQRKKIRAQIDHRIQLEAPVIFRLEGLGLRHRCDLERVERGASTAEDIHCNGTCVKSTRIVDMALYTDKDITKTAMTIHEMEFAYIYIYIYFFFSLQNLWKFY